MVQLLEGFLAFYQQTTSFVFNKKGKNENPLVMWLHPPLYYYNVDRTLILVWGNIKVDFTLTVPFKKSEYEEGNRRVCEIR